MPLPDLRDLYPRSERTSRLADAFLYSQEEDPYPTSEAADRLLAERDEDQWRPRYADRTSTRRHRLMDDRPYAVTVHTHKRRMPAK